ncbi:MAG: aminopeptidase P N-terminal domain-containing protein [Planctomycetota bacterium]|nr:aminopeptidase P N-terminal domain-containing protein [Planctomycetota bacterium]
MTPTNPRPDFRRQREALLEGLERAGAAAVFTSGREQIRNADSTFRFRPDSDFYYLTGFCEPDAVLVLAPLREGEHSILFLRDRDREREIWTGRRLGVEAAPQALGVDRAAPIDELWNELPELLLGHRSLVYQTGQEEERDRRMVAAVGKSLHKKKVGDAAPEAWIHPSRLLHEQRLVKSEEELACMRRAAAITTEAHRAAMAQAEPGRSESEIDALLDYTFRRRGGNGPAYTNIVAGGANACILHYVENDALLRDGDLLLIDAAAEWGYYATDVTRTFPVGGRFTLDQRALYDIVLGAQLAGIAVCAPGASFISVHETALRRICEGLVELGLLEGPVERVIEEEAYRRFYMHRTGHWLGLDVHDCGDYYVDGASRALAPGMVITVEPGIYVAEDDDTVDERWRGIGIRIEDDVLITAEGHEVLTADIPKEVDAVEAACNGGD